MRSSSASTRRPRTATSPFTRTLPSAISSSQWRRLPMPARARTFWSRSPSGSSSSGGRNDIAPTLFVVVELVGDDALLVDGTDVVGLDPQVGLQLVDAGVD